MSTSNPTMMTAPARTPAQTLDYQAEDLPELDNGDNGDFDDSAYAASSNGATTISSSVLRGYYEKGRRYQATGDVNMNIPSDAKQFESMAAGHLMLTALESLNENPYFRAPISKDAKHILDLGTGRGDWVNDVADMFPHTIVHGIDLYPPPTEWVAPNAILEMDDFKRDWTWGYKFDLVHLRLLFGSLSRAEFAKLYRRAYDNLEPGGWIEALEVDAHMHSNDDRKPLPADAALYTLHSTQGAAAENSGSATNITEWMKEEIQNAGFTNIHERHFKLPIGDWPNHPVYKEAGRLAKLHMYEGIEGWCMWLLTKYGSPKPWSPEEVLAYCAKMKNELDQGCHIFQWHRRVWAQKPYAENSESKTSA